MLHTILLDLFNFLTKPYLKELKGEQLTTEFGFLQGEVLVENVELDCNGLGSLNLPIQVVEGHVENIHIAIPWGSFCHRSTVLEIGGILLKATVNKDYYCAPKAVEIAQAKEEKHEGLPHVQFGGKQRELWFYEKVGIQLAKNLVVVIKDVQIQLEDNVSHPGKPQTLDIMLNSIQLGKTDKSWFSIFARLVSVAVEKKLELQHLTVQWSIKHSPETLDQESAWSPKAETTKYQHRTLIDHHEITADMKCIVIEDSIIQLKVAGDVQSSPINIDISQDLILSIAGSVLVKNHIPTLSVTTDSIPEKPKIIEKHPLFPLSLQCSIGEVRMVYRASGNNRSYSVLLSEARVVVEQESHDSVVSIKLSELAMGIHGAVEDHVINVFKGVTVDVITEPALKVEARLNNWDLKLPSLEPKLYSYFPRVVAKVQDEEENIAFVQVWEDTTKGGAGTTCILLGLHNAVLMYHQAFTAILLDQLNRNFNLLSELVQYIPKQNLELQCPEICIGLELSSVTTYIPIISLQKTHYVQTILDSKKHDVAFLSEKHDVKVDLLDISRYLIRNECVEFSPCGPPMAQLHGIDLLADVYERVGYPNNKLSDLKIEVEKFLLKGGMQFGIDLKNFITDIKEMVIKMFLPGLNVYPGTVIEPVVRPQLDSKIGSLQKTKLGIVLKELEMCVLLNEIPYDQPKGLCDARFFAITLSMNEFYDGQLNMEIAVPTWTMLDCRLTPDAPFTEPVCTNGMFSKPSIGISYQRDHNQHESVLLNISLTRIFLWIDFLKDMVDFWIQVVPPEKDKNPEVALETLLTEQKGNMPRLEFVLNFNQDCDIVIIESAYLVNPISLVVKFMGLTHFELDKYTWTQNMRVNAEKIVVECNYHEDIDKQCWKLLDITSFKMMAYGKPEIDPTDITFTITHVLVSLTATSAQMLITMIPNMIPAPQDSQMQNFSSDKVNLWEAQPMDTNVWYLTGEDVASVCIEQEVAAVCVNTPKMKVNLVALELRLDNEINQKIYPAVAINCTAKAEIIDWLKDVMVTVEVGLEATYYNDQLAVWEPLLEPIETSHKAFRPWVLKAEVVKNTPNAAVTDLDHERLLKSSLARSTKSLAGRMGLKAPEFSINVTADEPLQITLTKKFLKLIIDVAIDFITPTGAKPINQDNISVPTAPFKVVNKLGPTFEIRVMPGDTLVLKGNHRYAYAANDEMLELYYKKSKQVLQSSSLCSKQSGNLDHITINVTKNSTSTPFPPLRSIPVTRTGKYYYSLKSKDDDENTSNSANKDESDYIPDGIVLDITLVKGQRVVTVRSPVQFINHTTTTLKVYTRTLVEHLSSFTREYNDIEFAAVHPDQTCAVPLVFADYLDFSIEPEPDKMDKSGFPEYSLSKYFSRTSSEEAIQIDCESLLGTNDSNSLHIWLVIEEEEYVYNMNLPSSVPHHTFHLYPVAYFHNLLPFDIYLGVENAQGMKESHAISKGQNVTLSCFSLEDTKTTFHYKIEDNKESQTIQIKKEKSFVYSFHHVRGHMTDYTLLHFDKKDTLEIYLYAPFWFVNKTELTLQYRVSHTKDVITHKPDKKLMLFSFGNKYDGKKAIKMRMHDSSEWSKSISLDTAGYHGVIDIVDKFSVMKAGVKIRLTRCTLSKLVVIHPFYILVNKTKNRIICHEIGKQWLDIAPDSTKAFWPMQLERPLMEINVDGHGYHSDPFNYNTPDSLLLKFKDQLQAIKVIIHVTSSTHVIVFDSYTHGDCPIQLVNDFRRATIEFQQATRSGKAPVYVLGPCHSLMYTWDVPHEEHMIRWWVQGEKKEKGKDQLMSLEDGSGKFDMNVSGKSLFSERGSKSSSMLGVPSSRYSIDPVDYSTTTTTDNWTLVNLRQKSVSPPPTSSSPPPPPIHTRAGSFDLHAIEPSSPMPLNSASLPAKTWRSISAQPDLDSDTTPLVEFMDTKHRSSLQRRGALKRSSTKHHHQQQHHSGKDSKSLSMISKALSKSSSDLSEIDGKSQKPQKKPPTAKRSGYWISMMDGFQRILLFTPQYSVVKNCEKANRLNFDALEVNFNLKSVSITLIDNNTNREVLLLSILPKPSLWEMKQHRGGWEDIRSGSLIAALEIGKSQQLSMIEQDKLKVDMVKMKMISPVPGDLRCTSYNAIQAQLKMGANNIFVQLRAYDIQLDNQLASRVYSIPLYTEVCNKPDSPEQAGETWFLDAGVLLRKDSNEIVTRLDYLNATLQPIYLRTDVGLVLALMDMFSCLQQDMTEQEKLLLDVKYASLTLSEKEVALASKKAGRIFYENFNIPELTAQITFTTKNLNQSKGDLSDESAHLKFLKLFLTAMGTPFTEISEAEIKIGTFTVSRKSLTSQMLGDLIAKHYRHEALGQIFSVLIGLDLIKKPVSAVIGGTKKIFHGAYEGITHGIGELSEGIKQVRSRAKDDASQIVSRARARSLHVPLWDSDFGVASSKLDILKSVTETDLSFIHRVRPTRRIQKDRIVRPYALIEAAGNSVFEMLPDHGLTDVEYRHHFLLDDVPISMMLISNKSLHVANKSHKWQEEYHTLLEDIEYFVVEGNSLRVTTIEKKSSQHGSMLNRDISTRDNRTAREARDVLHAELVQLGMYKP